jgi:hypothetical protein
MELLKGCCFTVAVSFSLFFVIVFSLVRAGWRKLFPKEQA